MSQFLLYVIWRSETQDKDRQRLQTSNQELSAHVERLKDQLSSRNDDAQTYKQKALVLEQKVLETETRLNKSEESQMSHDNIQDKLHKRWAPHWQYDSRMPLLPTNCIV